MDTKPTETKPEFPTPSKSKCLKILHQVIGPSARFQRLDGGGLAVFERIGPSERPIVECFPTSEAGAEKLHYAAMIAAIQALGFKVERTQRGLEVSGYPVGTVREPLEAEPETS